MKAIIFGATGQDGSHLADLLLDKSYSVIGIARRCSVDTTERIRHLEYNENFELIEGDITDVFSVMNILGDHVDVDEIYNLAAQSHVATSFEQPDFTFQVNALGPLYFLEAIRRFSPQSRFYQASTSEMFCKNYTESSDIYGGDIVEIKYQNE